jgi:hypothetical protein
MRRSVAALLLVTPMVSVAQPVQQVRETARPVIRTRADLPQGRFPVPERPTRYVFSPAFINDFLPRLRAEAEQVLAGSEFVEAGLRRQMSGGLAAIALIQNRPADAERLIVAQRAVETQPQLKALALLHFDGLAAVRAAPPSERCAAGARRLRERIAGTNPLEARQEVTRRWSTFQLASEAFNGAGLQDADRESAQHGGVDLLTGLSMASVRALVDLAPPCRQQLSASLRAWLDDPANAEPNIWPDREPAADIFAKSRPVTVAVWDSGLDYTLFAGQLAADPAEPLDGRDNDGNGVVDDVHGPTFDARIQPSSLPMQPLSAPLAERFSLAGALYEGDRDLELGLDTPMARHFALHARSAPIDEQAIDVRLAGELTFRRHGTFIGSQILEGLPFVRLYNVRMLPGGFLPEPIYTSEPEMERWIAQLRPTLRRMRAAGVRVVNMSWDQLDDGGHSLIEGGLETDAARARQRSRAMYDAAAAAWRQALAETPDILFVIAAGNDGSRNEDIAPVPTSLPFPNIVVVGAVGPGGAPASFTSFGERVRLYASGARARGRAPGGGWAHANGTSMAAPLVVRTAAQMLAINPRLTPTQLIDGMMATATSNSQNLRLIHPAAAVDWARRQLP